MVIKCIGCMDMAMRYGQGRISMPDSNDWFMHDLFAYASIGGHMQDGGWTKEWQDDEDDIRWSETPNERKRIGKPVIETEPVGNDDWAKEMERLFDA
jgi:hypothetical protein